MKQERIMVIDSKKIDFLISVCLDPSWKIATDRAQFDREQFVRNLEGELVKINMQHLDVRSMDHPQDLMLFVIEGMAYSLKQATPYWRIEDCTAIQGNNTNGVFYSKFTLEYTDNPDLFFWNRMAEVYKKIRPLIIKSLDDTKLYFCPGSSNTPDIIGTDSIDGLFETGRPAPHGPIGNENRKDVRPDRNRDDEMGGMER